MKFYRGMKMTRKPVPCSGGCGRFILRANHHQTAKCPQCARLAGNESELRYKRAQREHARRYRILMALSPYGSWEELLEAVRIRQQIRRSA